MGNHMKLKPVKDGYTLKLDLEMWQLIKQAIQVRIEFEKEEMPLLEYYFAMEFLPRIKEDTVKLKLRQSEMCLIISIGVMKYLGQAEQLLLAQVFEPMRKQVLTLEKV